MLNVAKSKALEVHNTISHGIQAARHIGFVHHNRLYAHCKMVDCLRKRRAFASYLLFLQQTCRE